MCFVVIGIAAKCGAPPLPSAQARALTRRSALRMFHARQLPQSQSVAACRYARAKFAEMWGISAAGAAADTVNKLPHARAWLAAASGQLPVVESLLQPLGGAAAADSLPAAAPTRTASLPVNMRTGRQVAAAELGALNPGGPSAEGAAAKLTAPACARSWQGLVRLDSRV